MIGGLIMKSLFILLVFSLSLWSCTGDCFSCHPNLLDGLESDNRHLPMKTCINCHSSDNVQGMSACGSDCFSCHSINKIQGSGVKEHKVISNCVECHTASKKFPSNVSNEDNFLADVLFKPKM